MIAYDTTLNCDTQSEINHTQVIVLSSMPISTAKYPNQKIPSVPLTTDGLAAIVRFFKRCSSGFEQTIQYRSVIQAIFDGTTHDKICSNRGISLSKLQRMAGYWSVSKNRPMLPKNPKRGKGRRNYSKWNACIDKLVTGLNNNQDTTISLCKTAGISYQTLMKYALLLVFMVYNNQIPIQVV